MIERETNLQLLGRLARLAGLGATIALGVTLLKVTIAFGGNTVYLSAVLERISLSGLAIMTLGTLMTAAIPSSLPWAAGALANPTRSSTNRITWLAVATITLLLFPRIIYNIYWILALALYATLQIIQYTRRRKLFNPPKPPGLLEWGRQNRLNQDTVIRSLAKRARQSNKLDKAEREALAAEISDRVNQLRLPPDLAKLSATWLTVGAYCISLVITPPIFSALYRVETIEGVQVAYMIRGSDDVLLIDRDSKTPRVWPPEHVLSWQLCGPPAEDPTWINQPMVPVREDGNTPC